ncbi:MAG: inositol monophosphatase [Burkholderiaceae bacterium]
MPDVTSATITADAILSTSLSSETVEQDHLVIDPVRAARAAEQAAYAAGTHLQTSRSRLAAAMVTRTEPHEIVRAIGHEATALIRSVVLQHFPGHGFVGDDDSEFNALAADEAHWVVDAINGNRDYLRGQPRYAVSIALVQAGEPQVGVVYDPCRNEFFGAIRGCGVVLNGEPMPRLPPRATYAAVAATIFGKPNGERLASQIAELGRVVGGFGSVRRTGSMALEMAHLAAGRIDAFWEHDGGTRAAAAGILLLRESGALIHARDGRSVLDSRSRLACWPAMYEPFLSLLGER